MELATFIEKWEINKSSLARKIGKTKQCFNQKLSDKIPNENFSPDQLTIIKKHFLDMGKDIKKIK